MNYSLKLPYPNTTLVFKERKKQMYFKRENNREKDIIQTHNFIIPII